MFAFIRRSWRVLTQGALAMLLGFALAAFFVLPAAYEQRWVHIEQVISPDFRPESWEFTWAWDPKPAGSSPSLSGLALANPRLPGAAAALPPPFHVCRAASVDAARPGCRLDPDDDAFVLPLWRIFRNWSSYSFRGVLFVLTTAMTLLLVAALARFS